MLLGVTIMNVISKSETLEVPVLLVRTKQV